MSPIDEIKERIDIVELISQQVELRRTGRSFTGFCPFHPNSRTPAFVVYPDTQSFYCFGCHAAGTVFDYVMRQQGLDFPEALRVLAERAGIELRPPTEEEERQDQQRTRLLEINSLTARYFNYIALHHPRGQPGRDYLAQRGLNNETIEAFQLGYSLNETAHLLTYLTTKEGYEVADLLAAGVIVQHETRGVYDRFRGRVMFPIRNAKGQVVGFGGRALGDAQPKYLNTPQTVLFDKSHTLYGLDRARDAIRQQDACIIVEGYVDVLTAHQHGFRNVVAPLGTALTSGHVALIRKLSHNVYLALDADAAGQRATLRGLAALQQSTDEDAPPQTVVAEGGLVRWSNDLNLWIIQLPAGTDPDDLIRTNPTQWQALLEHALPVMDFYIQYHTAGLNLREAQDRRTALERLLPLLADLDSMQQRVYVAGLEDVLGMRAELLLDLIQEHRRAQRKARPRRAHRAAPAAPADPHSLATPAAAHAAREDYLVALLLRYPEAIAKANAWLRRDLAEFAGLAELLGDEVEHLLSTTANRMLWQHWQQVGCPPLPNAAALARDPPHWVQSLAPSLYDHLLYLAGLTIPGSREYLFMHEIEKGVIEIRKAQVRQWQERLGMQAHDQHAAMAEAAPAAPDLTQTLTLLNHLLHYSARISTPQRTSTFFDLRDTLERSS